MHLRSILFFILLLFCRNVNAQVNLSNGLVGHWPFNGNTSDISGNGFNATPLGGPALTTDRFNNPNSAYSFDGVDDYMSVVDPGAFSTPNFSVSFWFYMENDPRIQVSIGKRDINPTNVSEFGINMSALPSLRIQNFIVSNTKPCALFGAPNEYYSPQITEPTYCSQRWYHLVITFFNGTCVMYLNGQVRYTGNSGFSAKSACNSDLRFGMWFSGDPAWFHGKLDDIRWYNRALNQNEVSALYVTPAAPPSQPNCSSCTILPQASISGSSTCPGTPTSLSFNATSGNAPFTLVYSDGTNSFAQVFSSNTGTISVSPTINTTYTIVSIKDGNGCDRTSGFTTPTFTVAMNPKPLIAISPGTPSFCPGDSVQLSASGGTIYKWSPTTGLSNPNIANPKAAPLATTVYQVVVTNSSGCKDSTNITVTRNSKPNIIISASPLSVCYGDSTQLQASGGNNYSWSPVSTLSSSTIANPKAAPTATTIYKVVVFDLNGCRDSTSITVTLKPKPTVTVSPTSTTACFGDSAQFLGAGAVSYQWSPATGLSATNIPNPKAAPPVTTIYKILGVGANGCKDSTFTTLTVSPKIIITISPLNPAACSGDSIQLNASGGVNYQWSPSLGLSNTNIANPKAAPAITTVYKLVVKDTNGCRDSTTTTISVGSKPIITLSPSVGNICPGDSLQLSASGGNSYHWTPSAGISSVSIQNPKASPGITTTYQVVVTNLAGCKDSASLLLTVKTKPTISISPIAAAVCAGDSLQIVASGGGTYLWSPVSGLSNPFIANPKAAPLATTTYKLVVIGANRCSDSANKLVSVAQRPTISLSAPQSICSGDSAQLNATGGSSYFWSPSNGLSSMNAFNPKASPAITTVYQVLVTNIAGCSDSTTTTVSVKPKPTLIISSSGVICTGDSLQLSASGAPTFQWAPVSGLNNATIANPKASPINTTNYLVTGTGSNGCSSSGNVVVTVNPKPQLTISPPTSLCQGDSVQLNVSGGNSYIWSPATGLNNTTIANPKASPGATLIYKVLATTNLGCRDSSSVTVTVLSKPTATVSAGTTICQGDTTQLVAGGGSVYSWKPALSLTNAAVSNPRAFPQNNTLYTVIVSNNGGCKDSAQTLINVNPGPQVSLGPDTTFCAGGSVTLSPTASANATFLWNNGSTAPQLTVNTPGLYWITAQLAGCTLAIRDSILVDTVANPTVELGANRNLCTSDDLRLGFTGTNYDSWTWNNGSTAPVINTTSSGTYSIIVRNACATASDFVSVFIETCNEEIYFPSAFTPNKDGKNDRFRALHATGVNLVSYELSIYNRWGECVFSTHNLDEGWDGTFRQSLQDSNTFVWFARYRRRTGDNEVIRKGSFVIIR